MPGRPRMPCYTKRPSKKKILELWASPNLRSEGTSRDPPHIEHRFNRRFQGKLLHHCRVRRRLQTMNHLPCIAAPIEMPSYMEVGHTELAQPFLSSGRSMPRRPCIPGLRLPEVSGAEVGVGKHQATSVSGQIVWRIAIDSVYIGGEGYWQSI
jgi:hypothetical protein